MSIPLLTKLLFVHFTADYLLQFGFLAEGKARHGLASWHIWVHILLHGVLVHLVLQTWWITLLTLISHGLFDAGKVMLQGPSNKRAWFFCDQSLHLAVVLFIAWWGRDLVLPALPGWLESNLALITGLIIVSKPSKYMVGVYLTGWIPKSCDASAPFKGNGPLMGMAERLVVVGLIVVGWIWAAVVMAALKIALGQIGPWRAQQADDRRMDLVGSVLSLGLAALIGWLILLAN